VRKKGGGGGGGEAAAGVAEHALRLWNQETSTSQSQRNWGLGEDWGRRGIGESGVRRVGDISFLFFSNLWNFSFALLFLSPPLPPSPRYFTLCLSRNQILKSYVWIKTVFWFKTLSRKSS